MDEIGGEGGAQLLGSKGLAIKIRGVISTQIPSVDAAIGRGGVPLGRLTMLHGKEGSGKTTLALHIVAECQRQNGIVVYMDKEYKLDPDYAAAIGVNTSKLIISQPSYLEKVFETSHKVIESAAKHRKATGERTPILLVLDSMNAAITKAQFEGEWEDKYVAPASRVFSELLPKLVPAVHKEDISLLWISQMRQKIGVMFGDDVETCGGNAPKHWASLILKITRIGTSKADGEKVANKLRIEPVKNQISPPFRRAECEVTYGTGIDKVKSLLWLAEKQGLVKKGGGGWYSFGSHKLGQGMDNAAKFLREMTDVRDELAAASEKLGW